VGCPDRRRRDAGTWVALEDVEFKDLRGEPGWGLAIWQPEVMKTQDAFIAHAHFFLGRYDEAASWAAMALQNNPDFQAGARISAVSNAMSGRPEEAHETAIRLQRLNPTLRVSNLKHVLGQYRRGKDLAPE